MRGWRRALAAAGGAVLLATAGVFAAGAISADAPTVGTATFTVTYPLPPTVTVTVTVTGTTATTTATTATTTVATTTAPTTTSPPPAVPTVTVPNPVIPPGAITVTPTTLAAQLTTAPLDTTLVLDPGTYTGDYFVNRRVNLAGRPGAVIRGRLQLRAPGSKLLGGLEIDGSSLLAGNACIWVRTTDITIERTTVHDCYDDGIFASVGSHRLTVQDNWVHHNGRVVDTLTGNVRRHGIYYGGGDDTRILNNVFEDNQGFGVQVYIYGPSARLLVQRNTILRNGSKQWGPHTGASGIVVDANGWPLTSTVEGNVVAWHASGLGIRKSSTLPAGNVLVGNLAWQNADGSCPAGSAFYCAGFVDGGGNITGEPFTTVGYGSTLYR